MKMSEITKKKCQNKRTKCLFCGGNASLRCSICFAFYCSQLCQQDDWYYHQEKCKPPPVTFNACSDNASSTNNSSPSVKEVNKPIIQKVEANNHFGSTKTSTNCVSEIKAQTVIKAPYKKFHLKELKKYPIEIGKTYKVELVSLDCNLFVRLQTTEVIQESNTFFKELKSFFTKVSDAKPDDLDPGELLCIYDESDQNYYRAEVRRKKGNKILCHYIDYGYTDEVNIANARIFDSSFLNFPVPCLELKQLTTLNDIKSVQEVLEKFCCLNMIVFETNPLMVDLKDESGKVFLTSRNLQDNKYNHDKLASTNNNTIENIKTYTNNVNSHTDSDSSEIYSKTYEEASCLSLPIEDGIKVEVLCNNLIPTIQAIPVKDKFFLNELEDISKEIKSHCNNESCTIYKPKKNELVLAHFHKDEQWYRAAVIDINENNADVVFVDYGNVESVKFSYLRPMLKKFMKIPVLALTCRIIDLPDQLSEAERKSVIEIVNIYDDFEIDVKSFQDFEYNISIPTLQKTFKELFKTGNNLF